MSSFRWKQIGALGGIVYVVLQLTGQMLVQVGGAEPAFTAPADEILNFFMNRDLLLSNIGGYLSLLSAIPLLWFIGTLWAELQSYEEKPGWMSALVFASGAVLVSLLSNSGGWALALFRINEGISAEMARTLFDDGNMNFANVWVAVAAMLLPASIVGLKDRALPRWLGWFGLLIAVSMLIVRGFWAASGAVFLPYVMFWVWLITMSILLMRRASQNQPTSAKMVARQT